MKKKFKLDSSSIVIAVLILGVIIGYYIGATMHSHEEDSGIGSDEMVGMDYHSTHSHEMINITTPASVSFTLKEDAKSGYNLHIITENFTFSPENASLEHIEGEGHAHLYINGEKIQRIYGNWVHIDALDKGTHTIQITLNANDHSELSYNGEVIEANQEITVS